jgi:hypothetical protein
MSTYIGDVVRSEPLAVVDRCSVDAVLIDHMPRERYVAVDRTVFDDGEHTTFITEVLHRPAAEPLRVRMRGAMSGLKRGVLHPEPQDEWFDLIHRDPGARREVRVPVKYQDGYWVRIEAGNPPRPGDSGALVVDEDDSVVGMLVAMEPPALSNPRGFCLPIAPTLAVLNVELV